MVSAELERIANGGSRPTDLNIRPPPKICAKASREQKTAALAKSQAQTPDEFIGFRG
ncbi:MAG: hypothetical protein DHS20C16_26320 [Phycisphaerae bacterium]|nr:MAG: hypothetical protein DHS20C16_26320 [Phycisphaerae bacterium]